MNLRIKFILFTLITIMFINSCNEEPPVIQEPDPTPPVYDNGTGEIGTIGGTVKVTDPTSQINGTFVKIPAGALDNAITISINEAQGTNSINGDSTNIFIVCTPSGTIFNSPIEIGIPYKQGSNTSNLKVYYFDENSLVWKNLPMKSLDIQNKIIVAETYHFTLFTSDDGGLIMNIDLYKNIYNKISAAVVLQTSLNQIKTDYTTIISTGATNIRDLLEYQPLRVNAYYRVTLREDDGPGRFLDDILETHFLVYDLNFDGHDQFGLSVRDHNTNEVILTSPTNLTLADVEEYYTGAPVLFSFDYPPQSGEEYYVEVELFYGDNDFVHGFSGGLWGNEGYFFSSDDEEVQFANMLNAPDEDGDDITNDYDIYIGESPIATINSPNNNSDYEEGEIIYCGYALELRNGIS